MTDMLRQVGWQIEIVVDVDTIKCEPPTQTAFDEWLRSNGQHSDASHRGGSSTKTHRSYIYWCWDLQKAEAIEATVTKYWSAPYFFYSRCCDHARYLDREVSE